MKLRPGLVSVSFRALSPSEIIPMVVSGGLQGIEWGGDIHVPHGSIGRAGRTTSVLVPQPGERLFVSFFHVRA